MSHPAVLEVAVIGAPDAERARQAGGVRGAEGGRRREPDALAAELMQHCKTRLAPYKFPRSIHFVPELPKTATGKIQRFRLRQVQTGEAKQRV